MRKLSYSVPTEGRIEAGYGECTCEKFGGSRCREFRPPSDTGRCRQLARQDNLGRLAAVLSLGRKIPCID